MFKIEIFEVFYRTKQILLRRVSMKKRKKCLYIFYLSLFTKLKESFDEHRHFIWSNALGFSGC